MSVLGLCLRIIDSGLFAWISRTALSRTYFIGTDIHVGRIVYLRIPSIQSHFAKFLKGE